MTISWISISDIVGEKIDLFTFNEQALRILQTAEFKTIVGGWIETINPELGQNFNGAYQNVRSFDHTNLMAISSFSGLGRLPEITIPVADIGGVPLGVSLAAGNYQDEFLLNAAKLFFGDA